MKKLDVKSIIEYIIPVTLLNVWMKSFYF